MVHCISLISLLSLITEKEKPLLYFSKYSPDMQFPVIIT